MFGGVALLTVGMLAFATGLGSLLLVPATMGYAFVVLQAARAFGAAAARREAELVSTAEEALTTAAQKGQFLANMSHEIRTPMNGILGMAELLVRTRLDQEQQQMATTIQSSAESLLAVLNDILDWSKIQAGKLEIEAADFDLWQVVDDCAGLLHGAADQKGVELMTFVDPRLWRCHRGDAARVRQVLLNLVSNAVKFTLEGEVVLGVDLLDEDDAAQLVQVWVSDTGIGMSQESLDRLFQPFAQAERSTTRRFGGTGLGLMICRRLVELMGGDIEVTSAEGQGSTFVFRLRLPKGELANARVRAEDLDLSAEALLLVDDNETGRELMLTQLVPTRIGIGVAANAISAIDLLRKASRRGRPFTMAIVDLTMPGFDGIQLAEAIRNDPAIKPLPIALASSLGARPDLSEMLAADVFRWLNKPLAAGRLLQVVQDMAALRGKTNAAAPVRPAEAPAPNPLFAPDAAQARVLVAEDNEINRRVLAGMLRRLGCEATFAVDGREAVQLVAQREFDLVLMDCQMPELDGFEASRQIRAMGDARAAVPILALTANVLPSDRDECLAAGMNDFLSKPVKLDVLRAAVQQWSRRGAGADGGASG
ncbi:MAG: response regulator [Planctomycetes bacterium]|nr:response regulator [Planctomycetota bacterium]